MKHGYEFHGLRLRGVELVVRTERPVPHRGHHGSWIRGVLGHALFRGNCLYDTPLCSGCALSAGCPYPRVFKPFLLPEGKHRLPPYLLHRWQGSSDDERFWIQLVLIGSAVNHTENWIRQLARFARELDWGGGGAGDLVEVRDLATGKPVFKRGAFRPGAELRTLRAPWPADETFDLELRSPLVSKHRHADPLLGPLRTRLQRLVNHYGDGSAIAPRESPWRIARCELRSVSIPWGIDGKRLVKGWRGRLGLTALTEEGANLLSAGYYLHAGGDATQGFGRYDWRSGVSAAG